MISSVFLEKQQLCGCGCICEGDQGSGTLGRVDNFSPHAVALTSDAHKNYFCPIREMHSQQAWQL